MDMHLSAEAAPTDEAPPFADPTVLWYHAALCQLSLPTRATKEIWRRDTGQASATIEVAEDGPAMPSGRFLRLLLLHILDSALRGGSAVVAMGENAEELAQRIGADLVGGKTQDLAEQYERLVAAKLSVSLGSGAELGVFDARGRSRGPAAEWRASLRLNARFFTSLAANAVGLDRKVVAALIDAPMAIDTYAWITQSVKNDGMDPETEPMITPWPDMQARFGAPSQDMAEFRAALEEALRLVTTVSPAISVVLGETGVSLRPAAERIREPRAFEAPAEPPAAELAPPPVVVAEPPRYAPPPPEPDLAESLEAELAAAEFLPPPADPYVPEPFQAPRGGERPPICLKSHLTGLQQVIWLSPSQGRDNQVIEVSPGGRYDPDTVTVLTLEPMILQIRGGLHEREFERVASWAMTNRDLIDDVWDGLDSMDEINRRVKKVPAPGWRDRAWPM